jgi:hypothetical protein
MSRQAENVENEDTAMGPIRWLREDPGRQLLTGTREREREK